MLSVAEHFEILLPDYNTPKSFAKSCTNNKSRFRVFRTARKSYSSQGWCDYSSTRALVWSQILPDEKPIPSRHD